MILKCERCGFTGRLGSLFLCPQCNGCWNLQYSNENNLKDDRGIWKFSSSLPVKIPFKDHEIVGSTPLIELNANFDCGRLFIKDESQNPTRSFKDRGIIVGASRALEDGATKWFVSSSGNAAHSVAYFAHKASIPCWVELPPTSNVAPICQDLGATVTFTNEFVEAMLGRLYALLSNIFLSNHLWNFFYLEKYKRLLTKEWYPLQPHDMINPYIGEGYKTIAYEICDAIGDAPDYLFIPSVTGNSFNGIYRGFLYYLTSGHISKIPKMMFSRPYGKFMVNSLLSTTKTIINHTKGSVVGFENIDLEKALDFLKQQGLSSSDYGASGLAALIQAKRQGMDLSDRNVVVLMTGGKK